jgi:sulfur relay (sulfurtransferase) complex TusBCD TusD component (DsrE family)
MPIKNQCIIIRHPAYGREDAYAAIRMTSVGNMYGLPTDLVLCEDGVWNAVKDQWSETIEMPSNEEHLIHAVESGAKVYVDAEALEERGLTAEDLIDGVHVASCEDIAKFILEHDAALPLCGGF